MLVFPVILFNLNFPHILIGLGIDSRPTKKKECRGMVVSNYEAIGEAVSSRETHHGPIAFDFTRKLKTNNTVIELFFKLEIFICCT